MNISVRTFYTQKDGNEPHEYEDSFHINRNALLFSVADGTTESSFSGKWADLLTRGFVNPSVHSGRDLKQALDSVRENAKNRWHEWLKTKTIPWYAEEKVRQGADAAFIGLKIHPDLSGWEAVAVGDCCLFIVRDNEPVVKFPIESDADFGNTPGLLGSVFETEDDDIKLKSGDLKKQDTLFLLSDAIAQWFLKDMESHSWEILTDIKTQALFDEFTNHLRKNKKIRNDDMTIMKIDI